MLGDGTNQNQTAPAVTAGLTRVIAVSDGKGHVCAMPDRGEVWCWGLSAYGEGGPVGTSWVPVAIPGF